MDGPGKISYFQRTGGKKDFSSEIKLFSNITAHLYIFRGFSGGTLVKNSLAVQEMRVQSLGQEDPLEEEMATHSSTLAWRIPGTEEPSGLWSMGLQSQTRLSTHIPGA